MLIVVVVGESPRGDSLYPIALSHIPPPHPPYFHWNYLLDRNTFLKFPLEIACILKRGLIDMCYLFIYFFFCLRFTQSFTQYRCFFKNTNTYIYPYVYFFFGVVKNMSKTKNGIHLDIDLGENKVSVKQSASGFWYCADITVNCTSVIDGVALMDRAMEKMSAILKEHNNKEKDGSDTKK